MTGGRRALTAAFIVTLLAIAIVPFMSSETSADAGDVTPSKFITSVDVDADSSTAYYLNIVNNRAYVQNDTSDNVYIVITAKVNDSSGSEYKNVKTSVTVETLDGKSHDNVAILEGQGSAIFKITISANRFASEGNYSLVYTYSVYNMASELQGTADVALDLHVVSDLSTTNTYNKFLGIFPNTFDGFMGTVWFTVAVTILAWFVIGLFVMCIAVPVVTILMTRKDDPDRPVLRRSLIKQCIAVIIVFTIVNSLCVFGVDEHLMDTIKTWAHLIYLLIGIGIAWRIYKTFLDRLTDRMRGRDMIAGGEVQDFESFKPLFLYIGEIVLAIIGVFIGLGMFHVDLAAIITSAGVVTLGITLGAQQVLNQFFSGLVILSTRPFRKGDIIQLGTGETVYRVRKVNVMNTELENWDNSDVTIVPNNAITSSNVKNITRDTLRSKVHLFVSVSYKTDLAKARAILVDVANANPRVIKDGSVSRPSTRVTGFEDSNITLRLTVWVDDYNDHGSIGGELRVAIFNRFKEAGINIDYPQVVLHQADPEKPDA